MKRLRRKTRAYLRWLRRNPVVDIIIAALIGYTFCMAFILLLIYTLLSIH